MLRRHRRLLMLRRASSTRAARDERGASALEMAFIAPGFILLIFFSIQGALYYYGKNVAIQAAREGTAQLRVARDVETYNAVRADVESNTRSYATSVGRQSLTDPTATSTYDDAAGRVTMVVTGNVMSLIPGVTLGVTANAEGPVERFEAPE